MQSTCTWPSYSATPNDSPPPCIPCQRDCIIITDVTDVGLFLYMAQKDEKHPQPKVKAKGGGGKKGGREKLRALYLLQLLNGNHPNVQTEGG